MWNRTTHCTPVLLLSAVLLFASPVYANKLSDAMSSDTWHKEADELLLEEDGTLRRDAKHWCRGRLQEYYDCPTTAVPIVAGLSAEMLQTI